MPEPTARISTGVPHIDRLLGGGLVPGTQTVVVGTTGIGKTQLGLHFAHAGLAQEKHRGILFDLNVRGDPQSHAQYAERIFDWQLRAADPDQRPDLDHFFDEPGSGDYLNALRYQGPRITRDDRDWDAWHSWQAEINARLSVSIGFFYRNFVAGVRRVVLDGIEPVDRPVDSIQLHLLQYVYQQILRKDPEWVARDLFRQDYRKHAEQIHRYLYNPNDIACMVLLTSHEVMLDDLLSKRLDEGDLLSGANTIIMMGKIREGNRMGRALHVAKHRGSACSDEIVPFTINDAGLQVDS